jgi:hypothetical protein
MPLNRDQNAAPGLFIHLAGPPATQQLHLQMVQGAM